MSNTCGCAVETGKRVYLEKNYTQEDIDDFQLIDNKVRCAMEAMRVENLPEGLEEGTITAFVKGAINAKAEAEFLNQDWWKRMHKKYTFPDNKNIHIDFDKRDFYFNEGEVPKGAVPKEKKEDLKE